MLHLRALALEDAENGYKWLVSYQATFGMVVKGNRNSRHTRLRLPSVIATHPKNLEVGDLTEPPAKPWITTCPPLLASPEICQIGIS